MFKKISFGMMLVMSLLVGLYAVALTALPQLGHPELMAKISESPLSMFSHFVGSGLALIIGPFLFLPRSRKILRVHQYLGRVYMLGVLLGGLASIYMSWHADGGLPAQSGFFMLGISWLVSAFLAFSFARSGQIPQHQQMMFINFALTFAAVTLRAYLPIGALSGASFETYYGLIAWLCWVPNTLVAMLLMPGRQIMESTRTYYSVSKLRGRFQ